MVELTDSYNLYNSWEVHQSSQESAARLLFFFAGLQVRSSQFSAQTMLADVANPMS